MTGPGQRPPSAHGDGASRRRGLALVLGSAVIWSSGGLIARNVGTDPWTTIFWRCVFCTVFLLAFLAIRDRGLIVRRFREVGWAGLIVAMCFTTASTSFVVALGHTTVAHILIIQSTAPFLAALLGWLLMREGVRLRTWVAMLAALAGIAVMVSDSLAHGSILGDLLSIVIAFAIAGATVTVRHSRGVRMTPAACLAALFGGLIALPFATPSTVGPADLGLLALFGAGQLGVGLVLFTAGARLIPAAETALVGVLETILAPIWVWVFVGEDPGVHALLGGVAVVAALAAHSLLDLRDSRRDSGIAPPVA